jgi:hypothetical protein
MAVSKAGKIGNGEAVNVFQASVGMIAKKELEFAERGQDQRDA